MQIVKTVLADDHRMLRKTLSIILNKIHNIKILGEAENGNEVLTLCEQNHIDLVIMDINMPAMDGRETTTLIKERYPHTRVLIISMLYHENYVKKLFSAGASGYISKNCTEQELLKAVEIVSNGGKYISSELQEVFINDIINAETSSPKLHLSNREREVVIFILEGNNSKQIAEKMNISLKTVEYHRSNIYRRFKIKTVVELISLYKNKFDT